jgi:hypothetical protein
MEVINYMRSKLLTLLMLAFVLLLPVSTVCANEVANGDFSDNLVGWMPNGDVFNVDDVAAIGETIDPFYSNLFQLVELDAGTYLLSFDFKINSLSGTDPENEPAFPDFFVATLYLSDDDSFDPADCSDVNPCDFLPLFSRDSTGFYDIGGNITASTIQDFSHFSRYFSITHPFAIPTFDLFDSNFTAGDSSVSIDNVSITQADVIPEPGTLISMTVGLIGLIIAGRRRLLG